MPLPQTQVRTGKQSIALSAPLRACILASNGELLRKLAKLLRPYKIHFDLEAQSVSVSGETAAVELTQHILEALDQLPNADAIEAALAPTANTCIEKAMQHDLAFRLPGLRQPVRPLSLSQVVFLDALLHDPHELILGVGPSGTGKTHLAIAAGLNLLSEGKVKRLILTRPHVLTEGEVMTAALRAETGNDTQLTPFLDELRDLVGEESLKRHMDKGEIAIMPIGLMRGRTFNDCFIVVDEAQNMPVKKMRMTLNRLGQGSRMVITGDPAHVELHEEEPSGLAHLMNLLKGSDLATIHVFESNARVRNSLAARLDALYEASA